MNIYTEPTRVIHTHLYSEKAFEVCSAVDGQMSDGWGENSPSYEGYWRFCDVRQAPDGEVIIYISKKEGVSYSYFRPGNYRWIDNRFRVMSDDAIRDFYARMIKKTATMELKDKEDATGWKRHNTSFRTKYLSHEEDVSIAEVYAIYEFLLGRILTGTKYDVSVIQSVIGQKRSEDETNAEQVKADKRAALDRSYQNTKDKLKTDEEEEIKAVRQKYFDLREAALKKYREEWAEIER